MKGRMEHETLCWYCKKAGKCNKPVGGWDAEYRPVKVLDGTKTRLEPSWLVSACPNFDLDRGPVDGSIIIGNRIFSETEIKKINKPSQNKNKIFYNGEWMFPIEVARINGISKGTLKKRLACGWDRMRAATEKPRKQNYSVGPIIATNEETKEIKRWDSLDDAEKDGFIRKSVVACCNNRMKKYKGWRFRWE